jgi:sulfatase maturation enzyme AslB (radical SAM superfamily)
MTDLIQNNFYGVGDKTDKKVVKGSAVNTIYFTNKCNLACTYCYEDLANRPPQILSKEEIRKSVDMVFEREDPNSQSLFVLFGGEPTLEWDNVCYLMEYAYEKKKKVHFNMITNGLKYLSQKFIEQTKSNFFYQHGFLTVDVSFDGKGNKNRIFHNGKDSTLTMLQVFKKLNQNNIRYRIRYTIHNLNIHNLYEDISLIIKTFRPLRLITSVAWDTLKEEELEILKETKEKLRTDWINKKINVPVCELFCDMCSGCDERKELKTYYTDEGNVRTKGNYENAGMFKDFKPKELI